MALKNNIFCIFLLILFFLPMSVLKPAETPVSVKPATAPVSDGSKMFIKLDLAIDPAYYIYSNPKGPGTGQALELSIQSDGTSIQEDIYIDKPEKYHSKIDKNWVWRHKGKIAILIPQKIISEKSQLTLKGLACDDSNCEPFSKDVKINDLSLNNSAPVKLIDLSDFHSFQSGTHAPESDTPGSTTTGSAFVPRQIQKQEVSNLFTAIITAFIAGLILNIMPCVLPVLSLKLSSLIKHSHKKGHSLLANGIFYTLGVYLSFLVLASLSAFAGKGWGTLFQSTSFLLTMIIIIFALSLSMLGVYSINPPSFVSRLPINKNGNIYMSAFLNGLFITLLATPCSGPFLGATLAWTLTQPVVTVFTVFMSIATGLALPYLLISAFPVLFNKIPKSGSWTLYAEKIFGFMLMATIIYFLSILDHDYILFTLTLLFFIAIGLWQYGIFAAPARSPFSRNLSYVILLILMVGGAFASKKIFIQNRAVTVKTQPFSYPVLESYRKNNQITVVKFTADWCPNCILVENGVIKSRVVQEYLKNHNIALLNADITRSKTEGEELLRQLNSSSIPFLAVFVPGKNYNHPFILRDVYTKNQLLSILTLAEEELKQGDPLKKKIEGFSF